jgi:hypothetical protein
MENRGRGRLSSIQLLPDEAFPHVRAAIEALKENKRPQESIREELNEHLLALGLDPVSRSAFNRYSLRLAIQGGKLQRAREVGAMWAESLKDAPKDDVSLLLNESLMVLIYDIVTEHQVNDGAMSIKMIKEAALAQRNLLLGKKALVETAVTRKAELEAKVDEAVTVAAKAAGLSAETAEEIKSKILGIARDA